ncbi:hypothetical protein SOVF_123440 [Spinacia oleracea]|nr:hypothetical protein SOVF_123440 [Spinacia oleracea]
MNKVKRKDPEQNVPSKKRAEVHNGVQSSTPLFLEINDFDLSSGDWEATYRKQVGAYSKRIDINMDEYSKIDKWRTT